jgi:hypothetical protein
MSGSEDRLIADRIVAALKAIRSRHASTADKLETINALVSLARPTGGGIASSDDARILVARTSTHLALAKLAIVVKRGSRADAAWDAAISAAIEWSKTAEQAQATSD